MVNTKETDPLDQVVWGHTIRWWRSEVSGTGNGRRYSWLFKRAVLAALNNKGDRSILDVLRVLGVKPNVVWIWRKQAKRRQIVREQKSLIDDLAS